MEIKHELRQIKVKQKIYRDTSEWYESQPQYITKINTINDKLYCPNLTKMFKK